MGTVSEENPCDIQNVTMLPSSLPSPLKSDFISVIMSMEPKGVGLYDNYRNKSGQNYTFIKIVQEIGGMLDILGLNHLISSFLCFLLIYSPVKSNLVVLLWCFPPTLPAFLLSPSSSLVKNTSSFWPFLSLQPSRKQGPPSQLCIFVGTQGGNSGSLGLSASCSCPLKSPKKMSGFIGYISWHSRECQCKTAKMLSPS